VLVSEITKRFGLRVRRLRKDRGLSQEKLAFDAGIHRTYLGSIERGERNPTLKNITRIARALGVSLAELFAYDAGGAEAAPPARPDGS
jgi:transcriptional regulator with XRE-family HTH domain